MVTIEVQPGSRMEEEAGDEHASAAEITLVFEYVVLSGV